VVDRIQTLTGFARSYFELSAEIEMRTMADEIVNETLTHLLSFRLPQRVWAAGSWLILMSRAIVV